MTLFCPFWVKHNIGHEEKVFLVPFLYMRPPSWHTWALSCTKDELGQLQKVRGLPLSEIGGVLLGTPEVGGVAQTAALTARVSEIGNFNFGGANGEKLRNQAMSKSRGRLPPFT